jgi:hypothetical protein
MITRVLVAPLNYSHRQRGQIEAFRDVFGRENVREFDFMAIHRQGDNPNTRIIATALEFKPDWIWLQVQGSEVLHGTTIERLRRSLPRCLITHWMGDLRLEVNPGLADTCRTTHVTMLSNADESQHAMYRAAGARRVEYVQIGLDPEDILTTPGNEWDPPFAVPDVVFCGGHYGHVQAFAEGTQRRLHAIRALLMKSIDVGVVGSGWPSDIPVVGTCHVKQQVHVYKRAKVALSINHFNGLERYYSDRHLIALASGTPVVAHYVPGLDKEFVNGGDCHFWFEIPDLIQFVQKCLADRDGAIAMGRRGQQTVLAHHTWKQRIEDLRVKANVWHDIVAHEAMP